MTVLTTHVRDIAGADDATVFTFETPTVRGGADGGVVTVRSRRYTAEYGVLTTDDLEPGPAVLRLSGGMHVDYRITIPDSDVVVQLWPLIDAATPPDDTAWMTGFVRNAGGVARIQSVPAADYPGLVKDPNTFYILY
ncbi:hypothetical protein F8M49_20710 [Rhodococcus zopfii]|uniref:Uncharacterized protein n=1 Tax=Rhodococcus zopfii TaxID=43772 RepID=A0ABU3WT21_9NOCA|nr:hypothetical protein [Rhodococcus zopfii]